MTSETVRSLLVETIKNVTSPLVVLIDGLEKVKYSLQDQTAAYMTTVAGFTRTFEDVENDHFSCVVILDDH